MRMAGAPHGANQAAVGVGGGVGVSATDSIASSTGNAAAPRVRLRRGVRPVAAGAKPQAARRGGCVTAPRNV